MLLDKHIIGTQFTFQKIYNSKVGIFEAGIGAVDGNDIALHKPCYNWSSATARTMSMNWNKISLYTGANKSSGTRRIS